MKNLIGLARDEGTRNYAIMKFIGGISVCLILAILHLETRRGYRIEVEPRRWYLDRDLGDAEKIMSTLEIQDQKSADVTDVEVSKEEEEEVMDTENSRGPKFAPYEVAKNASLEALECARMTYDCVDHPNASTNWPRIPPSTFKKVIGNTQAYRVFFCNRRKVNGSKIHAVGAFGAKSGSKYCK